MQDKPGLADNMRKLALTSSRGDELRERADDLDRAILMFFDEPPGIKAQQFLLAWARARRIWCEITGDPLI